MIRVGVVAGVLAHAALGVAQAESRDPDPRPADPRAEEQAQEANLESNLPRAGLTFSGAIGGGIVLGSSVGRGPAISLRLGHVATSKTIITFELTGGSALHALGATTFHDDDFNLMTGAQYYTSPSLWIRAAGGVGVYTLDGAMTSTHPQLSGVAGAGLDLARWRYVVLGIETFAISSLNNKGLLISSGLCLGLSYY